MSSKVKVAVRVRPFSRREVEEEAGRAVSIDRALSTILVRNCRARVQILDDVPSTPLRTRKGSSPRAAASAKKDLSRSGVKPPREKKERIFHFDYVFDSSGDKDQEPCSQQEVFETIGDELLDNVVAGYNCCVFAYGQTGSGKTHSLIGRPDDPGLIPRVCQQLFSRMERAQSEHTRFRLEASLLEIYNEKITDLLSPERQSGEVKVREHPRTGPYAEGLTKIPVRSPSEVLPLVEEGFRHRTTAATSLNAQSSRSHAVFTITFTQATFDSSTGMTFDRVSELNMVDLAGSERLKLDSISGPRLKETGEINRSLLTLSRIITILSEEKAEKRGDAHIPYRDSTLTWLLKESLGGNAKTLVIATVSPSEAAFEETLSTLRYAQRSRRIVNVAKISDPTAELIKRLKAEVQTLQAQLAQASLSISMVPPHIAAPASATTSLITSFSPSMSSPASIGKKSPKSPSRRSLAELVAADEEEEILKKTPRLICLDRVAGDPLREVVYARDGTEVPVGTSCTLVCKKGRVAVRRMAAEGWTLFVSGVHVDEGTYELHDSDLILLERDGKSELYWFTDPRHFSSAFDLSSDRLSMPAALRLLARGEVTRKQDSVLKEAQAAAEKQLFEVTEQHQVQLAHLEERERALDTAQAELQSRVDQLMGLLKEESVDIYYGSVVRTVHIGGRTAHEARELIVQMAPWKDKRDMSEYYLFVALNDAEQRTERCVLGTERPLALKKAWEERYEQHLYSFHWRDRGRVRVYRDKENYTTLSVHVFASAREICETMLGKMEEKRASSYCLTLLDMGPRGIEAELDPSEKPIVLLSRHPIETHKDLRFFFRARQ